MSLQNRLNRLQKSLKDHQVDALIIDKPIDIFYLTGISVSIGRIFMTKNEAFFIIDGRYFENSEKKSPIPCTLSSDLALTQHIHSSKTTIRRLGFDDNYTSYASYQHTLKALKKHCKPPIAFIPCSSPLAPIRLIKDAQEILYLQRAADLGSKGFDYACSLLTLGVSEIDIAKKLEIFWKQNGADKLAFDINISFGANSAMPHHRTGDDTLKNHQIVLMDLGLVLNHYNSDMTRTLFFGSASKELKAIYEIVKKAQASSLSICKPGVSLGQLDKISRQIIENTGFGEFYTHSLGHGIGLEVHEQPIIRDLPPHADKKLKAGMTITIEPGIYLPNKGGVRIEDTVLITNEGHLNLTQRSKELTIIKR